MGWQTNNESVRRDAGQAADKKGQRRSYLGLLGTWTGPERASTRIGDLACSGETEVRRKRVARDADVEPSVLA